MSIVTTQILGTDSISASRIVINDNFAILRDEINSLETYLDPNAATIDSLNSIQALELRVGPVGNFLLEITSTDYNINTSVNFSAIAGLVTFNGLINHDSFSVIDEAAFTGTAVITPESGTRNYVIKHASTGDFTIQVLDTGNQGQDITFFVEQKGSGDIIIQAGVDAVFVFHATTNTIIMDGVGSSVTLRQVTDSSSNGSYFIVSSHNITLTV